MSESSIGAFESKAGTDLLHIILQKGAEQYGAQVASSPTFFNGSLPSRVSNPLIEDVRFRDESFTPILPRLMISIPSGSSSLSISSSSRKGGCVWSNFGNNPAVRIERIWESKRKSGCDDCAAEDYAKQLDSGHKVTCPWRGNSCVESLVQFPPAPPSALIEGYKDRCDGLLQFLSLPIVAAAVIEQMRVSRGPEIDHFLVHSQAFTDGESGFKAENISGMDNTREEAFCRICLYSRAQKLKTCAAGKPRWLPNIQDCEEHSAQSARNRCSFGRARDRGHLQDAGPNKKALSASTSKHSGKNEVLDPKSKSDSRSPLLDCSLCGATVRIWDFLTVSRPARFAPTGIDIPETSKKTALTRGVSAVSGINGWVATDGMGKEQTEDHDEAGTADEGKSQSNVGLDLNLTIAGGLSSRQLRMTMM